MVKCTRPIYARFEPGVDPRPIFKPSVNDIRTKPEIMIPCRRCINCRINDSEQWAIRCVHESKMHEENSFLTLTYDDDHIPEDYSLVPGHFTQFVKAYRQKLERDQNEQRAIKFFGCGEYGSETQRPHYHLIIFGHSPSDKVLHTRNKDQQSLYTSEWLSPLWKRGHHLIGDVSFQSAKYIAGYHYKKRFGIGAKQHYGKKIPEFLRMSRGGKDARGLGYEYFWKYYDDFNQGYCVIDGKQKPLPAYYQNMLDLDRQEQIKEEAQANRIPENYHDQRLEAAEKISIQRMNKRDQI